MAAAQPDEDYDGDYPESTPAPPTVAAAPRERTSGTGGDQWWTTAYWEGKGRLMTLDDFDMTDTIRIGSGKYGVIHAVQYKKTGEWLALKECFKKQFLRKGSVSWVMNERYALARLNSPYVIKLLGAFHTTYSLYFVMEYMPNGDLSSLIHKFAPFHYLLCRHYTAEITAGLDYLRESEIIHRDLKPENILLDIRYHIKIADFGACTTLAPRKNMARTGDHDKHLPTPKNILTGTPVYNAPEIYKKEEQSFGTDLWSLGCIIFEMYTGKDCFNNPTYIPWNKETTKEQSDLIMNAIETNIAAGKHTPWPRAPEPVVQDLVNKLLKRDPNQRIGMHPRWRVTALKAHNFFNGINWPKLHLTPPPLPIPQISQPPPFDITDEQHPEMVAVRSCKEELVPISASVTSASFMFSPTIRHTGRLE